MKGRYLITIIGGLTLAAFLSTPAFAEVRKAKLQGIQEVPAVSTAATGECRLKISKDETSIDYEVTYSGIEGATVLASHIHFAQPGVNGGIVIHFCGTGGKPACPPFGTVSGTATASDVTSTAGGAPNAVAQGIDGELAEVIRAIRAGRVYCNVHSSSFTGGEIRGQLK